MKQTLNTNNMVDQLLDDDNANWSYNGAVALIEYLEELDLELEMETEFNVVDIRCEYSEYKSLETWAKEYFGTDDEIEIDDAIREYLQDNTTVIEFDGGIIIADF